MSLVALLCDPFKNWASLGKQMHHQAHALCVRAVSGSDTASRGHQILPKDYETWFSAV